MWAAKLPGEGAALADACEAMVAVMAALGVAVDGGKDSLSMAARVGSETVRAPGEVWGPQGEGQDLQGWAGALLSYTLLLRISGHLSLCCLSRHYSHCDPRPQVSWRERYEFLLQNPPLHCVCRARSFVWGLLCGCWPPHLGTGAVVLSGTCGLGILPHAGNFSAPEHSSPLTPSLSPQAICSMSP